VHQSDSERYHWPNSHKNPGFMSKVLRCGGSSVTATSVVPSLFVRTVASRQFPRRHQVRRFSLVWPSLLLRNRNNYCNWPWRHLLLFWCVVVYCGGESRQTAMCRLCRSRNAIAYSSMLPGNPLSSSSELWCFSAWEPASVARHHPFP
jgi:hypothetical protein